MRIESSVGREHTAAPGHNVAATPDSSGRVQSARLQSIDNYRAFAVDDQNWEEFATALTGKSTKQRSSAENKALKLLRQEILDEKIAPAFFIAYPATGSESNQLLPGVRGAYVPAARGTPSRVLISSQLRGWQLQKTSDEELGEAIADRAHDLGVEVAEGDAGERSSNVLRGIEVSPTRSPSLFEADETDETIAISNGVSVAAQADAGGTAVRVGADGLSYDLESPAGIQGYLESFDTDGNGLDRGELKLALGGDGVPDGKVDRFMVIYGIYEESTGTYVIPTSKPGSMQSSEPGFEYTSVSMMVADGAVYHAGVGQLGSALGRVSNATLAHAMIRHAATEAYKNKDEGDSTTFRLTIATYQQNGISAHEMDLATDAVLGDKKPLNSKNGHRDVIVGNFRTKPGANLIDAAGLTEAFELGALKRNSSVDPDDTIIGFTAHREPVSASNPGDESRAPRVPVTDSYAFPTIGFTDILFPGTLDDNASDNSIGVYATPLKQRSTLGFGWDRHQSTILGKQLIRREEIDATGELTGNVVWTLAGSQKTYGTFEPVTLTVKVDGKIDRYLKDYQDFSSSPQVNSWSANLRVEEETVSATGEVVQVWVPKEHQFDTHLNGFTAPTYDKVVITVDGKQATVSHVSMVQLPNNNGEAYTVTAKTARGYGVSVTYIPQNDREKHSLLRLSRSVVGPETTSANLDNGSDQEVANALSNLPPEETASILDGMDHGDASVVLALMSPEAAGEILANMPPQEAAEIINLMMMTDEGLDTAAFILAHTEPGNAGLILAELDRLSPGSSGRNGRSLTADRYEYRSQRLLAPIATFSTPTRAHQVAQVVTIANSGGTANPSESARYMQSANAEMFGTDGSPSASATVSAAAIGFALSFVIPRGTSPEAARNISIARLVSIQRDDAAAELLELSKTAPDKAAEYLNYIARDNPEAAMEILLQLPVEENQMLQSRLTPTARAQIHAAWGAAGEPVHQEGQVPVETDLQIADRMIADSNPTAAAEELTEIAVASPVRAAAILTIIANENRFSAGQILSEMQPAVAVRLLAHIPSEDAAEILARMEPGDAALIKQQNSASVGGSEIKTAPRVTAFDTLIANAEEVQSRLDSKIGGTSRHSDKTGSQLIEEASKAGWMVSIQPHLSFDEALEQGWVLPISEVSKAEQVQFIELAVANDLDVASGVIAGQTKFRRGGLRGGGPIPNSGLGGQAANRPFVLARPPTTRFSDKRRAVILHGPVVDYRWTASADLGNGLVPTTPTDSESQKVNLELKGPGGLDFEAGYQNAMAQLDIPLGGIPGNPDVQIVVEGQSLYAEVDGSLLLLFDGTNIGLGMKAGLEAGLVKQELTMESNFLFKNPLDPNGPKLSISIRIKVGESQSIAAADSQAFLLYNTKTERVHLVLGGDASPFDFDFDLSFGRPYPDNERSIDL